MFALCVSVLFIFMEDNNEFFKAGYYFPEDEESKPRSSRSSATNAWSN